MNEKVLEELKETIAEMPAFNHHDHMRFSFSDELGFEFDLPRFLTSGYLRGDLWSAGYSVDESDFDYLSNPDLSDNSEQVWQSLSPFLDAVKNTSYFRYTLKALNLICDADEKDILSDNWKDISKKVRSYSREVKGNGTALVDKFKITAAVLDSNMKCPNLPPLNDAGHKILHVFRMDHFIHEDRGLSETLEKYKPEDLSQMEQAFSKCFQEGIAAGAAGFKMGLAYNRSLNFGIPERDIVGSIFAKGILSVSLEEKTLYQDYMVNFLCQHCERYDLPLQVHTGMQAVNAGSTGESNILNNSNPTYLTPLFRKYKKLRFDLFHGGYPWHIEAGLMAKYFPNVYIDGCWLAQISPSAYRNALRSWLETVPASKIFAWGGDHQLLELTCSSLLLAKEIIADVLAEYVAKDYFSKETAIETAERILYKNGLEFWGI
ncbi:MAG: amidohydrolase family protein [Planctomycetota bacterium]|jgi:hypothetical protein